MCADVCWAYACKRRIVPVSPFLPTDSRDLLELLYLDISRLAKRSAVQMDLNRLIRNMSSQRVMRFKTAFFNVSEMIRDLELSHRKELLEVLAEL